MSEIYLKQEIFFKISKINQPMWHIWFWIADLKQDKFKTRNKYYWKEKKLNLKRLIWPILPKKCTHRCMRSYIYLLLNNQNRTNHEGFQLAPREYRNTLWFCCFQFLKSRYGIGSLGNYKDNRVKLSVRFPHPDILYNAFLFLLKH